MAYSISKMRTKLITILLILQLYCKFSAQQSTVDDETMRRVLVDLNELPELFSNAALPTPSPIGANQTNIKCYNLVGCFEELPLMGFAQNPTKLRTQFRIFSRDSETETLIVHEPLENCLKAGAGEVCEIFPYDLNLIKNSPFKSQRRTVIVVGGYLSKAPSRWELSIKDLWLEIEDVNVIVMSWTDANGGIYNNAAANTKAVARQLTVLLYYLFTLNGLSLFDECQTEKIYIVGHSLGAHIGGFVGQDLGGKVGRITGLDAAGPSFDTLHPRFRLDPSDAQLVDAMHTNAGSSIWLEAQYGSGLNYGHIDLWANDGKHQPGCKSDRLGCSHKKANAYYSTFLRHHIAMQNHLGDKNKPCYRLAAYASPSFEEFHNGSALMANCPKTVLQDELNSLETSDLDNCLIPIDYITWYADYKDELIKKHRVPFESPGRGYYFYTSSYTDDQIDHYLVSVQANKGLEKSRLAGGCDISFSVQMASGLDSNFEVEKYKLVSDLDEFEIIVPFLSPNTITKYELAKLDSNDFYISSNDTKLMALSLIKVLPTSVTIIGLSRSEQEVPKKKRGGIMGFFSNLMGLVRSDEKKERARCDLKVDSLTIQPLRKMHRHLIASYSIKANDVPTIHVIKEDKGREKLDVQPLKTNIQTLNDNSNSLKLYIDQVVIGSFDGSIDPVRKPPRSLVEDDAGELVKPLASPSISLTIWLVLIISMFVAVLAMILISIMTKHRPTETDQFPILDEQML